MRDAETIAGSLAGGHAGVLQQASAPQPADRAASHRSAHRSVYWALQRPPLSALASNGNDHTHVRAVAILGYN